MPKMAVVSPFREMSGTVPRNMMPAKTGKKSEGSHAFGAEPDDVERFNEALVLTFQPGL